MAKITLGAVGDMSFAGNPGELVEKNGPEFPFEHVLESLRKADVLFGNFESVMTPGDFPLDEMDRRVLERSGDHVWESIKAAGFDVLNQAANHVLDCGWRGLLHTNKRIREAGAQPVGVGATQEEARTMRVVEKNGTRIGFLGYLEPCNWTFSGGGGRVAYFDVSEVLADVRKNREAVDVLVVSVHADLEFRLAPSVPRVEACRKIAEAGADVVLGHHPHVPQGIERWGESVIAYSLGNFIFKIDRYLKNGSPHVFRNHILFLDIENGKVTDWRRECFRADEEEGRPYPLSDEERKEAEAHHRMLDEVIADPLRLRELWHESSLHYLKIYWNRLMEAGPEGFVENEGWRILCNDEHSNWVKGIHDLARIEYEKGAKNDFEFVRPNFPFQK